MSIADCRPLTCPRYVLDIGQSEDWLALQIAMAPCLLGYGAIAKRLHADPRSKREGNIYWTWIENYVAEDYVTAVKTGSGECNSSLHSARMADSRQRASRETCGASKPRADRGAGQDLYPRDKGQFHHFACV